jgi:transcriptional regulator with XRE-family HTH domain
MRDNNLTDADVARLLGRSENTIKMWRCGLHRPIPEHSLQLLIERLK